MDEAWAGLPLSITPAEEVRLEQVYSRGLGDHFIAGTNHQTVVRGTRAETSRRSRRNRGEVAAGAVTIDPAPANAVSPLKPGDGLVFDAAGWRSPQEEEEGGRVYAVRTLVQAGSSCVSGRAT